jgi:adenylyltransferase/sulfurtransferase
VRITTDALAEEDRFSRFELISWWDQDRMRKAKVLVIGAGALGNEIVKNCALLGIGNVLVADMDAIENSNLSRSVLFRASDNGSSKAETACRSARDIFPDMNLHPFLGNIVHDLGWGVYLWADVIVAGLDNREARVAMNSGSFFTRKPWIDGAIEVLDGVARVFSPTNDGPCYECTMSETDWKMLERRRSCALLTRDQMATGKVPTTPTTASIVAGIEVQEAVKIIHGIEPMAGRALFYNGLNADCYPVTYQRKEDCYGHDFYQELVLLGCGVADLTVGELLARARRDLGSESAVIGLPRDVIASLSCPVCFAQEEVFKSLGKVTESDAACPKCGNTRVPVTLATLGLDDKLDGLRFAELGVPLFDIVTARSGERTISYVFDGDAAAVLGSLPTTLSVGGE